MAGGEAGQLRPGGELSYRRAGDELARMLDAVG
jgi:hypothetical protein